MRDRELACYQGWGVDHWQPKQSAAMMTGSGAPGTGTGGSGGSGGTRPYGTLVGSSRIPFVPAELLDDAERHNGRHLDPDDQPALAD